MPFPTHKQTQLAKQDKSKKGSIDERIRPLIDLINGHQDYYTTSSCSGRVVLWTGSGKKDEMEWLKVSHDPIGQDFLDIHSKEMVWLRVEPLILHIRCQDLTKAITFLDTIKPSFKKSCLLTVRNKIIVEIRGSEFLEMPLYRDGELLWNIPLSELSTIVNQKMEKIIASHQRLETAISKIPS